MQYAITLTLFIDKNMERDYEKEYKAMVQRASELHEAGDYRTKQQMEIVCPELADEDEMIRKELIEFIQWSEGRGLIRHDFHQAKRPSEWIAWLKKQKEREVLPPFDELTPEEKMNHPLYLEGFDVGKKVGETLKEQKPAEWSEEDEDCVSDVLWCIDQAMKIAKNENDMGTCWSAERFIKSLRPQPHLKPSEEDERTRANLISLLTDLTVRGLIKKETRQKYTTWLRTL